MKDLLECGEVKFSEHSDPEFSCLFCKMKLNSMELIIEHINSLHKDKITFEPEKLKRKTTRKPRKSELPVSEWINREKKESVNGHTNDDSKILCDNTNQLNENNSKEINVNIQTSGRPKRQIKKSSRYSEIDFIQPYKKSVEIETKEAKEDCTTVDSVSNEKSPIKIKLRRKGSELIVEEKKITNRDENFENIEKDTVKTGSDQIWLEHLKEKPVENDLKNLEIKDAEIVSKNILLNDNSDIKGENEKNESDIIRGENSQNDESLVNKIIEENLLSMENRLENYFSDDSSSSGNKKINGFEEGFFSESSNEFSELSEDNDDNFSLDFHINSEYNSSNNELNKEYNKNTNEESENQSIVEENSNQNEKTLNELGEEDEFNQKPKQNTEKQNSKRKFKFSGRKRKMNEFGEYVCDNCGNTYKKATSLSRHRTDCRNGKPGNHAIRVRNENGMYPCTYNNCEADYSTIQDVFKHEREKHGKKRYARPQIRTKNEFGDYVCDICGNVYKKGTSLSRHRSLCREGIRLPKGRKSDRTPNEKGMYQCAFESCEEEFLKIEEVIQHEKKYHNIHKRKKIGKMCEICGKWLTSACSFKSHMLRHTGQRNFKCDSCPSAFYDKYALALHQKCHLQMKDFTCEFCDKKFLRANDVQKHIKYVHCEFRPEPVMCDICGKYFSWNFDLKKHIQRHYNVKNIRCEFAECNQMFASRSDLKKHLITHNPDIKPWQCEICSNSFSRKSTLVKHQKLHTGRKEYECSICGKAFAQSPGLYMHMKTHGFNVKTQSTNEYDRSSQISGREKVQKKKEEENIDTVQNNSSTKSIEEFNVEKNLNVDNKMQSIPSLRITSNHITGIDLDTTQQVMTATILPNSSIQTIGETIQINLSQIDLG